MQLDPHGDYIEIIIRFIFKIILVIFAIINIIYYLYILI